MLLCALAAGCTRDNPAFDRDGSPSDTKDPDAADGESTSATDPSDETLPDSDESDSGSTSETDTGTDSTTDSTTDPTDDPTDTGDPEAAICDPPGIGVPLPVLSVQDVIADGLDSFVNPPAGCEVTVTVCQAMQSPCNLGTPFMVRQASGGGFAMDQEFFEPVAIQVHIELSQGCGGLLMLDASQQLELSVVDPFGNGQLVSIPMPCAEAPEVNLWIAADGASFWDPALFDCAAGWL
jgi:hypothetical protein